MDLVRFCFWKTLKYWITSSFGTYSTYSTIWRGSQSAKNLQNSFQPPSFSPLKHFTIWLKKDEFSFDSFSVCQYSWTHSHFPYCRRPTLALKEFIISIIFWFLGIIWVRRKHLRISTGKPKILVSTWDHPGKKLLIISNE